MGYVIQKFFEKILGNYQIIDLNWSGEMSFAYVLL